MKPELVYCRRWSSVETDFEAYVRCGPHGTYGYGDTPLEATRRAWHSVRRSLIEAITKELTE